MSLELAKETNKCPKCNLTLVDDYWDTVVENEKGEFVLDAFEAWVCPNRCGYYIKMAE